MMHDKRLFRIVDVPQGELPSKLVNHTWTLCSAFRCGPLLFLNDATHEDGAGEYAVIREATGEQIESITFSWCSLEKATEYVNQLLEREVSGGNEAYTKVKVLKHQPGSCHFCA
jgi:hypothetical protein